MKITFFVILMCCLCGCFGKKPTLETGHEGKPIPSINLLLLDSITHINLKTWKIGKPVVLIDISPTCPYCRALTQKIADEHENLKGIQFIVLSSYPLTELKKYDNEYMLKKYPNITVAQDSDAHFGQYFQAPGVPCIAIYGKDRLLKQVLMGKINTNLIKDIALE